MRSRTVRRGSIPKRLSIPLVILTAGLALLSTPGFPQDALRNPARPIGTDPGPGGDTGGVAALTIHAAAVALAGGPVLLTLEVQDSGGVAASGPWRVRIDLGGSCVFRGEALEGRLLEGVGTSSGLLQLNGARARILVRDAVAESVTVVVKGDPSDGRAVAETRHTVRFLAADGDPDGDGLTNLREFDQATDPLAADSDGDGVPDGEDNCPAVANPDQEDTVHVNGIGDACDDPDGDGVPDAWDNCGDRPDAGQPARRLDGLGGGCAEPIGPFALAATPVVLPFQVTDAAFDPVRAYVYVTDKVGKKVSFVNLTTGAIDKQFTFDLMPESLALTPDGSRLFVALLTREHSYSWFDEQGHEGYIASFDLATQTKDRQFRIVEDPFDVVATAGGSLVVSSGSGQWTHVRVFDAVTGTLTGTSTYYVYQGARLALHPSGTIVYGADTSLSPSDIFRFDLLPGGGIAYRWDSPYHGDHRMSGNVWAAPAGDTLVTRGGDVYAVGTSAATDMRYLQSMTELQTEDVLFDPARRVIFTAEGSTLRYYNDTTRFEIGRLALPGSASFLGLRGDRVEAIIRGSSQTSIVEVAHPVPNGGTNTAPQADFTVTPATGATTRTDIRFDASTSSDAEDPLSALQFRWDVDNDGVWDGPFSSNPVLTRRFPTAGTRFIRLQVKDSLALVGDRVQAIEVTFEADPGDPGPAHPAFELPFAVTDAAFDPLRHYLYVSDKAGKKVAFVNLTTGFIEKQFSFDQMPESLAVTPDGSRLFAALLTREHDYGWYEEQGQEAYIASFDLAAGVKDRQFRITEDPADIVAPVGGPLVVSGGSGQWTHLRAFDPVTGALTGTTTNLTYMGARLALHPSGTAVYGIDTNIFPQDLWRFDLLPGGGLAYRWEEPYHANARISGNVWAAPGGNLLVTGGGDAFGVGTTQATDMRFLASLSSPGSFIQDLAFDAPHQMIFTIEASTLHFYNLVSLLEIGSQALPASPAFLGANATTLYTLGRATNRTTVQSYANPGVSGNTPPVARFTITPAIGGTTRSDFVFDASTSSDGEDPLSDLQFRWDVGNDGVWDGPFSSNPVLTKRFATAGTKVIRMQVKDRLALVDEKTQTVDVAFEPDPGDPGQANLAFELPFAVSDVAFDPVRPYLYVSDKAGKKVSFVNLTTGFIERQFAFDMLPEMLALTPDGSRLFVSLLAQEHTYYGGSPGAVASFDLATRLRDRQFDLPMDPLDLIATSDGHIVVSPSSGLGGSIRTFDAVTGAQTGATVDMYPRSELRLSLHPSERIVYGADLGVSPSDIERLDLDASGAITYRWDSPYHGDHRMYGKVWASPVGDVVITAGGDLFSVGTTFANDMRFVRSLSVGTMQDLAFDAASQMILTMEGSALHVYNLTSFVEVLNIPLPAAGSFVGARPEKIYALLPGTSGTNATTVLSYPNPVAHGNTAPQARFTVTPATGGTTSDTFRFDASTSSDGQDALGALQFRWDVGNDGTWDAPFTSDPVLTMRFTTAGTRVVRMQVQDSQGLLAQTSQSVGVIYDPDPGIPGPVHTAFDLPFTVTDAAFDPVRPYLYVTDKAGKKVSFVNLATGMIERQFLFDLMPESLAITADGSRLFVALLTRDHSYGWYNEEGHTGAIASFDLATWKKDNQFPIAEDPSDIVATARAVVVAGGSGQWTYIRSFDATTGAQTGYAYPIAMGSRLALHPSGTIIYGADNGLIPSDIFRMDLPAGGGITYRWDSPYHGDHNMAGNVWASPLGDKLVTRGGDVFSVGSTFSTDMRYVRTMTPYGITDVAWDTANDLVIALYGTDLRRYRLSTGAPLSGSALPETGAFVGRIGPALFTLLGPYSPHSRIVREAVQNRAPAAVMLGQGTLECTGPQGAAVALDGSSSNDPDSLPGTSDDIASYAWYEAYGQPAQRLLGTTPTLAVTLSKGSHAVSLKVTDRAGVAVVTTRTIIVRDTTPPVLDCAPVVAPVECTGALQAHVEVRVTASDTCGGVTVSNDRTAVGADASGSYPLGQTVVGFEVLDTGGHIVTCTRTVSVVDTAPPTLAVSASPGVLWPPNHGMVPVGVAWQAGDVCDPNPQVTLVSVASNEPDDASGTDDGDTIADVDGAESGTSDDSVNLRAERAGGGPGRTYILNYVAKDAAANATPAFGVVTVPHDQGTGPEPLLMRLEPNGTPGMVRLVWAAQADALGYDVIAGDLAQVRVESRELTLGSVRVLARGMSGTSLDEGPSGAVPESGKALFYLVQRRMGYGGGGYGSASAPWPRVPSSCDGGCP